MRVADIIRCMKWVIVNKPLWSMEVARVNWSEAIIGLETSQLKFGWCNSCFLLAIHYKICYGSTRNKSGAQGACILLRGVARLHASLSSLRVEDWISQTVSCLPPPLPPLYSVPSLLSREGNLIPHFTSALIEESSFFERNPQENFSQVLYQLKSFS